MRRRCWRRRAASPDPEPPGLKNVLVAQLNVSENTAMLRGLLLWMIGIPIPIIILILLFLD
jgi:hypothetical protein